MSSNSSVLSLNDVGKRYEIYAKPAQRLFSIISRFTKSNKVYSRSVIALENISFQIYEGETVAVIGKNGAGKSTLLSIVSGNTTPTSGLITMRGSCSALLELGDGFDQQLTGRENLRLSGTIRGSRGEKLDELVDIAISFADIGKFIDDPVKLYSSGMYVRVAFAAAIMFHSELLIVDEALAVGDFFFQQKCYEFLENEMNGVTKLLVTHDLSAVAKLATRCIVLDEGKILFDGPPLQAIERYLSVTRTEVIPRVEEHLPSDTEESQDEAFEQNMVFRIISARALSGGTETDQITPGMMLTLDLKFKLAKHVAKPILGYTFRDRVGNAIFGMNSASSGHMISALEPGDYAARIELTWPEIENGSYSLTIGLGNGVHSHFHETVGWDTGVLAVTSISAKQYHGIFDGNIQQLSIDCTSSLD
jgi:ABC-type polysaccharide/polyol phosphate transport system ATPase subunit